jgi:hypothetical protein
METGTDPSAARPAALQPDFHPLHDIASEIEVRRACRHKQAAHPLHTTHTTTPVDATRVSKCSGTTPSSLQSILFTQHSSKDQGHCMAKLRGSDFRPFSFGSSRYYAAA